MKLNICISTQKHNKIEDVISGNSADIFVFPELALTGQKDNYIGSEEIKSYQENVFLGAAVKEGNEIFNEYILSSKGGEIYRYRKTHLGEKESDYYVAGNSLSVMKANDVAFGIALCIESHIPEISTVLCEKGAEVLIFPFATPRVCGSRKEIWNKYLPARAYDNNAYVIATNLYGGMMVISPSGEVLIENYADETITIEIDTEEVRKRRAKNKLNYNSRLKPEVLGKVKKYGF